MDIWSLADLCTPWCVHVAVTLRVAGRIAGGVEEIGALAEACGADRQALHGVLRHLAGKGVFVESPPGRFALNEAARQLLEPGIQLGFDLDGFGSRMAHSWGTLLDAVRSGRPSYERVFGRPFWDDLDAHPEIAAQFDEMMSYAGHGVPDPEVLPDPAGWETIQTVVDVGGGSGALLAEILRARPQLRGILVDLPRPVAKSAEVFASAGVEERATAVAQSFFDPLPGGADLYILKSVLSDWPDREATLILQRCAEASRPSQGRVVFFTGAGPGEQASPELLMLVLVGGRARTIDELREICREAGLEIRAIGRQRSGRVIVECRPTELP